MEGQDAISLGVYKERGLPDEGIPRKNKVKEIRTRIVIERESKNSVHPCARTSSSGEIAKNHLYN